MSYSRAPIMNREVARQTECPLFRLPAEIRLLVFEYVFGSGMIHTTIRECTKAGSWLLSIPHTHKRTTYCKWSYATCRHSCDWQHRYALSRVADTSANKAGNPDTSSHAAPTSKDQPCRSLLHCVNSHRDYCEDALDDIEQGHYNVAARCYHSDPGDQPVLYDRKNPAWRECQEHRQQCKAKYGSTRAGVKKYHRDSAIDLSLLRTCKLIHSEARALPYTLYTFECKHPGMFKYLALNVLQPFQVCYVESMYIRDHQYDAMNLKSIVKHFPGLKRLRFSQTNFRAIPGNLEDWKVFFDLSKLQSVQVISAVVSHDEQAKAIKHAEALERFLSCSNIAEASAQALEYLDMGIISWDGALVEL